MLRINVDGDSYGLQALLQHITPYTDEEIQK